MRSGGASRTAIFVCQGRAVADGRLAVGRFSDPVAARLLRPPELVPVRLARGEPAASPDGGRGRFAVESVRACAEIMAPRTVVIDEAVTVAVSDEVTDQVTDGVRHMARSQVVLLGAGLDTRPWRLPALRDATVFSVDHPASQADARDRASALTALSQRLVFVPVDLTAEPLDGALASAGHDATAPTVWVWEGVVPYLREADVIATTGAMAARSAAGSVVIVNYQTPSAAVTFGRFAVDLLARFTSFEAITADEPWQSAWTPAGMAELLARHGFDVEQDVDLEEAARRLHSPTGHGRSLRSGRVAVARRHTPG